MTDLDPRPVSRTGMKTWLKVLLAASLTVNLAVAGMVLGTAIGHDRAPKDGGPHGRPERFDPALGPFSRALPEPYRTDAAEALRERGGEYRQDRRKLAQQVTDMIDILRADPFDGDALQAALSAQSAVFEARADLGRDVVLEQIARMSDAERDELADRLEQGFRKALDRARED